MGNNEEERQGYQVGILKRKTSAAAAGGVTIIAQDNRFSGDMRVQGKLHVDGSLEGKVDVSDDLSIGKHGVVRGQVKARELHVNGSLEGEVVCDALFVEAGGRVVAKVLSQRLSVDPRGCFQGERRAPAQEPLALEAKPVERFEFGIDAIDSLPDRIVLDTSPGGRYD